MIARRAVVTGRVQGVFFRATVARAADREGVAGWAANRPDGAVEVHLEGEPAAVERVLAVCRSGPRDAEVEHVELSDAARTGATGYETR